MAQETSEDVIQDVRISYGSGKAGPRCVHHKGHLQGA